MPLGAGEGGRYCCGVKQCEKAVARGQAARVYIAADAEERLVAKLKALCAAAQLEVDPSYSMAELGQACGIKVKAAAAALLKA